MIENLAALRAPLTTRSPDTASNFDFAENDPRKLEYLSLEQQKKRAKEMLREWRSNPSATATPPRLSDAQHAIAQGYGFTNWSELKNHIVHTQIARDAINGGEPTALDSGRRVLHIRCGNDIQHALTVAGFIGDFLNFADPYVHGPVPQTATLEEFINIRAGYISSDFDPTFEQALKGLTEDYRALEMARDYDAVYLWFEHDSYDQLIVAKLLDFFSDASMRPPILRMINITHFPGVKIFNGIGQLPPTAMRVLWEMFTDVTPAQLAIGQQAWAAIRSPVPLALQDLIATGTPALSTIAPALRRHLLQLPSKRNGLNLTENLTLQILDDKGPMNAGRLFGWYTNHYEPLAFMGDSGYWHVLEELATAGHAAISLDKQGDKPTQWQVALTTTGSDLLENRVDWLELNHIDRWVGGIHIDTNNERIFRITD
jgi:hypothetical protein